MKIRNLLYLLMSFVLLVYATISCAEDPPIIGNMEDATWELYTNTRIIQCMAYSDDGNSLWVGTSGGLEQRDAKTGERIRLYTKLDGLPDNYITSLVSDEAGGIWIGTYQDGLAHMLADGSWQIFNTNNSSLPGNYIYSLLSDGKGGIWIGTSSLAHISADGSWQVFNEGNSGLPGCWILSLLSDGKGGIWIGTSQDGLAHMLADGSWQVFNEDNSSLPDKNINSLLSDGEGGIWIGTYKGLAHLLADSSWQVFNINNHGLPDNYVYSLLSDGEGGIWIGTLYDGGLIHLLADGSWQVFNTYNSNLPGDYVYSLLSDGDEGIWIGTDGGLAHLLANSSWQVFNENNSTLPGNYVCDLLSDEDGGIWIGTTGGLAHMLSDGSWTVFTEGNSSLPDNYVSTLLSDNTGGIWIGTFYLGLAHFLSDGSWRIFNQDNSSLPSNNITALLSDEDEGIWIGTDSGLTHVLSNGSLQVINKDNSSLPANNITSLLSDGAGGIWIGTASYDGGLTHMLAGGSWQIFNQDNSDLPDNNINSLLSDGEGGIWIGTDEGLAHLLADGSWQVFIEDNSSLPGNHVYSLLSDRDNGIWIGTDKGLAHLLAGGSWQIFTEDDSSLPGNNVKSFLPDNAGGIWIGTDSGLTHLSFGKKLEIIQNIEDEAVKQNLQEGSRAAIIIAAGSTSARENKFWYSTEYITSQLIYSMFYNRGYDHSEIYYLSPKSWANFNSDGRDDYIVDAPVTSKEHGQGIEERALTVDDVQNAFEWAKTKGKLTQPFYFYFVDHGEPGKLMLTPFDALEGEKLSAMIDDYQETTQNKIVIIIEACYSGSLIPFLSSPDRVIITSSSADETSFYDQNGLITFSAAFCMNIAGTNLKQAFLYTKETMQYDFNISGVTPLLDDNGDGIVDDLDGEFLASQLGVNGTWGEEDASIAIEAIGTDQSVDTGSSLTLEAKTHAAGTVKKVWAVVRPPYPQVIYDDLGTPIMGNPTFNLTDLDEDGTYTGTYNGFTCAGDYTVTFFVKDYNNNAAVSNAIIVTAQGGEPCIPSETQEEQNVSTSVYSAKTNYSQGDTIEVQVQNIGTGFFDQYTAMVLPDNSLLFLTDRNKFDFEILPWSTTPLLDNTLFTVLEIPLFTQIPYGTYWIYNLLVPAGSNIFETTDQWILGSVSFSVE